MLLFRPINIVASSVYNVYAPKMVSINHENRHSCATVLKAIKTMAMIAIVPFLLLFLFSPGLFAWLFGENWYESGQYVQYIVPWLFLVFITSPMAFIPNIYNKQKQAMLIDVAHFILRIISLFIGYLASSAALAIILFSLSGVLILSFTLTWYIHILKKQDLQLGKKG
jgi:O-antigen/teichoic acid export membrane protein